MPRPEGKTRGLGRMGRMENPAKSEGREGPWGLRRPLREGGEEREAGLLPDRLDTRNGSFAQPRGLLPRTEEVALLIGTAVCGKPHVRWCERAGETKPSPLYSIGYLLYKYINKHLFLKRSKLRYP